MNARNLLVLGALLGGCTSTYHPEYHPVTVTSVHQTTVAPVSVSTNGPVTVMPAPTVTPLVIPEPQLASPDVVFRSPD